MASSPTNGYVVLPHEIQRSRVPLQTWAVYRCFQWSGYLINDTYNRIQCTGPGQWSKPTPTCARISLTYFQYLLMLYIYSVDPFLSLAANCGNPENPANGKCTATETTYGNKKTCSCNDGYRDDSFTATTCQIKNSKAKWGDPIPSCKCNSYNQLYT